MSAIRETKCGLQIDDFEEILSFLRYHEDFRPGTRVALEWGASAPRLRVNRKTSWLGRFEGWSCAEEQFTNFQEESNVEVDQSVRA